MESEDFYDSLDEGSDYDSCIIPKTRNYSLPNINVQKNFNEDLVVPFYEESFCLSQPNSKSSSRCSGILVQKSNTSRSRLTSIAPLTKPKKSYLDIYHDKIGVNKYLDGYIECDSSRPTCSSLSSNSFTACNVDIECDNVIDVDLKFEETGSEIKHQSLICVPELNLKEESGKGDFQNASDQDANKFFSSSHSSETKKTPATAVVSMASKSTDTRTERLELVSSKLQAWKKRLQYGQKVSTNNKIKMAEERALKMLEKERKRNKSSI